MQALQEIRSNTAAAALGSLTYTQSTGLLAPDRWLPLVCGLVAIFITAVMLFRARKTALRALRESQEELSRRRTTELALRKSERRFRSLSELSSDSFWESDSEHRITMFEPGAGYAPMLPLANLIGKARWETGNMHPADPRGWRPLREAMDRHELFRDFELSIGPINGEVRWYAISGEPLYDVDGTFLGYQGVTRQITERKRAEIALAASEARFRAVFERSNAGIAIWGLDGRFLSVNSAFCDFVGYAADELVGKMTAGDLRQPGEDEGLDLTGKMQRGEISYVTRDRRYKRHDATSVWGRTTVAAVKGKDGTLQYFVAVVIDITEAREARERIERINAELEQRVEERTSKLNSVVERLEEANRDLDSYNYSITHDLRQPLSAIVGFSDLLREQLASTVPGEAPEFAREIEANACRMEQMIEALLRFSRAGRGAVSRVEVDMRQQVESVLRDLSVGAPLRAEVLVGELPTAHGDETLLHQVWANLIGNALKYSGKNPASRVEISGVRHNGVLEYTVRDNGVGFDMRHAERMFGVFERLPSSNGFEGFGVGLAIVQRVVQRHGGQINGESAPGRGATFRFTLPA